mgnify:CR=1 FL=1|tara:strand:- start:399 stop:509 length:111 start_codon:yes stop_codon:yes gene_type:complete
MFNGKHAIKFYEAESKIIIERHSNPGGLAGFHHAFF